MNSVTGARRRETVGVWRRLAVALFVAPSLAAAAEGWYVMPSFMYTYPDQDIFDEDESSIGISLGRRLADDRNIGITFTEEQLVPASAPGLLLRHDLRLEGQWNLGGTSWFAPYLSAGIGASRMDYDGTIGAAPHATLGVGYALRLPFLPHVDVLNELRARYTHDDKRIAGESTSLDGQAVIGLRYSTRPSEYRPPLTAESAGQPEEPDGSPRGSQVSLAETCDRLDRSSDSYRRFNCSNLDDEDGDGTPDSRDVCRNTVPGTKVDADGCTVGP